MEKIRIVGEREKGELKKLLNDYLVEIAKFDDGVKFNKKGEPVYRWFDCYFKDYGRFPIYFVVDGVVAGFALVRNILGEGYEIAEFCVVKEYRGKGYAREFAKMICDFFDEQMEFSTNLKNERAVKFWSGFVQEFKYSQFDEDGRRRWIIKK